MAQLASARIYGFENNGIVSRGSAEADGYPSWMFPAGQVAIQKFVDARLGIADGSKIVFLGSNINGGLDGAWLSNETVSALQTKANA